MTPSERIGRWHERAALVQREWAAGERSTTSIASEYRNMRAKANYEAIRLEVGSIGRETMHDTAAEFNAVAVFLEALVLLNSNDEFRACCEATRIIREAIR